MLPLTGTTVCLGCSPTCVQSILRRFHLLRGHGFVDQSCHSMGAMKCPGNCTCRRTNLALHSFGSWFLQCVVRDPVILSVVLNLIL